MKNVSLKTWVKVLIPLLAVAVIFVLVVVKIPFSGSKPVTVDLESEAELMKNTSKPLPDNSESAPDTDKPSPDTSDPTSESFPAENAAGAEPAPQTAFAVSFEAKTTGGFTGRGGVEKLTVTADENHTDGGAYSLKTEGRTASWHGPSLRIDKYVEEGCEYKISVWVKLIEPSNAQVILSTQIGDGSSANYVNLASQPVRTSQGWVQLEGMYRYNNVSSGYLTVYVESFNDKASYCIDDIKLELTASGKIETEKDLTPIKNVYQNDFMIGNAISAEDMSGVRLELLKTHFNVATAGNAMKPDALQRSEGNFDFRGADALVDKVLAEGLKMHGHTLVWYQQSPSWMNTKPVDGKAAPLDREEALANLRTHIKTVIGHFGNKVISWDVVNEAMDDNLPNPSDWKASLRKSPWYSAIGPDYVEQAFLAAREALDENPELKDIKLYYNDYNLDYQNKAKAVYNMVKEINENYAKTHSGKLLIDGIGMQAHYNMGTKPANVLSSLEKFISLGVEISITELDIQAGGNYALPVKTAEDQRDLYAKLFKIFKAHSADIVRVTFWGIDDGTSWRSPTNPLLFDKNLQAKPAYYGVIEPDKYGQ